MVFASPIMGATKKQPARIQTDVYYTPGSFDDLSSRKVNIMIQ